MDISPDISADYVHLLLVFFYVLSIAFVLLLLF